MSTTPHGEAWQERVSTELLPRLRAAGVPVDMRAQTLVVAWLVANADAADDSAAAPHADRVVIRALVAKTRAEQAAFDEVFAAWLVQPAATPAWEPGPVSAQPGASAKQQAATETGRQTQWRRWLQQRRWGLLAAGIVLGLLALVWFWLGPIVAEQPAQVVVEGPVQRVTGGLEMTSQPRPRLAATPVPVLPPASAASAPPVPQPSAAPAWQQTWQRWSQAALKPPHTLLGIHPFVYAVLLLLLAATPYLLRREQDKELARITTARSDLREQEVYAGRRRLPSGAQRAALRQAARALRSLQPAAGRWLDVPATVQASVRAAGRFEAVLRARRAMRSCLVLIDRPWAGEARAQLAWDKARALAAEGVVMEVWEFDRDPRWLRPFRRSAASAGIGQPAAVGAGGHRVAITQLASRCAGMSLLMFTDGQGLIDPRNGQLRRWVRPTFTHWPERALLTPVPLDNWGPDENTLADAQLAGFFVAPALTLALPAVTQWWAGRVPQLPLVPNAPTKLPPELMGAALRWLSDVPVQADEQQQMLQALWQCLGQQAFAWLAASAAYPALSAELTAYLADALNASEAASDARDQAPLRDMQMLALAQLPWFRHGRMPDWWRLALLDQLSPRKLATVRAALESLLQSDGRAGDIRLGPVAVASAHGFGEQLRLRWQAWRRRQRSTSLARSEAPGSPLRDVIYLGVLDGSIDQRLRLRAPGRAAGAVAPLSANPLRWVAAVLVLMSAPVVWLQQLRRAGRSGAAQADAAN